VSLPSRAARVRAGFPEYLAKRRDQPMTVRLTKPSGAASMGCWRKTCMRQLIACALLLGSLAGIEVATAADEAVLQQLAPTRTLRVGVAFAPAASALFVTRDAAGQPHGVTVDLGTGLAQELGVAVAFILAPNTGDLTEATSTGAAAVSFMPVDEER
jgi:ABC-type amino acid transport substrate-binding protein